jgi:hypothetical protein
MAIMLEVAEQALGRLCQTVTKSFSVEDETANIPMSQEISKKIH